MSEVLIGDHSIETHPITISDKEKIDNLYHFYGHGDSAHAFQSLYLWKDEMELSLSLEKEAYLVKCHWKGEDTWFFPCGSDDAKKKSIEMLLSNGCKRLCYMTEEDVRYLEDHFRGVFVTREAPEDSEYLYNRREMMEMAGKAFSKIRNSYRRLEREHKVDLEIITEASLPFVERIIREWQQNRNPKEGLRDDKVTKLMLSDWGRLELEGVILYLDDQPWAVAAGYPLNEESFDCCLLKARKNLLGVTDHLRVGLARLFGEGMTHINIEEDLGIEGLRLMKRKFRPCGMIGMFTGERQSYEQNKPGR